MTLKQLSTARTAVLALFYLLAFMAIASAIAILAAEQPLIWNWTAKGFEAFFQLLHVPISLAVSAFAVFAVWLTLERIAQTDRQLQTITDHNTFNNYYRHLDEFVKHLSESDVVKNFCKVTNQDIRLTLATLYRHFYSENYRKFSTSVNSHTRREFEEFSTSLAKSRYNSSDVPFQSLTIEELESLVSKIDVMTRAIVDPVVQQILDQLKQGIGTANPDSAQLQDELPRYVLIDRIRWTYSFQLNILAFDGDIWEQTFDFEGRHAEYMTYLQNL